MRSEMRKLLGHLENFLLKLGNGHVHNLIHRTIQHAHLCAALRIAVDGVSQFNAQVHKTRVTQLTKLPSPATPSRYVTCYQTRLMQHNVEEGVSFREQVRSDTLRNGEDSPSELRNFRCNRQRP